MPIEIRAFSVADTAPTLAVFQRAIRTTAAADYSAEQIAAWAPAEADLDAWRERRSRAGTVVAVLDGRVAGFTDVDEHGYIDMMFVDPAASRRGVATTMLDWARAEAVRRGASRLCTHASITARPFFEAYGFVVGEVRHPVHNGVVLMNFTMTVDLRRPASAPHSGQKEDGAQSSPG